MLNWIKFISIFLISLTFVIVITIFYNANKPLASETATATETALGSGEVVAVSSVQFYNGELPISTVFGTNEEGEEIALFIEEKSKGDYQSVKIADGITADQAINTVKKELSIEKVLHVSLGIEEDSPVWEVVFMNENGKLNYVYVLFENGQWWKRILNL